MSASCQWTFVNTFISGTCTTPSGTSPNATYCLTLPGKQLVLSILLQAKKFRARGNKEGAVAALKELERAGLGELEVNDMQRGTNSV